MVKVPKFYAQLIEDPQLRFSGCQITGDAQHVGFYLEASNMAIEYLEAAPVATNYSLQRLNIDMQPATLASNKKFSEICMLLVRMSDYSLLLDGNFPNECAITQSKSQGRLFLHYRDDRFLFVRFANSKTNSMNVGGEVARRWSSQVSGHQGLTR